MHFALPRKGAHPYPRPATRHSSTLRQRRLQYIGYLVLGVLSIYLVFNFFASPTTSLEDDKIPEDSRILIVTLLDESVMSEEYIHMIKDNRESYAARHGYQTFYTNVSTYANLTTPSPSSWALIPALRNSLTLHPTTDYIWSLSAYAVIMNDTLSLHAHVLSRLDTLMLKDIPVVPPDSVIHTFSHLKAAQVQLVLTQDTANIAHTSFLLRNSHAAEPRPGQPRDGWSHYLLDAWFDPLYRAYAFQKAENHALEHIVQWHPTILAKLAIVDQRLLNSYNFQMDEADPPPPAPAITLAPAKHDGLYRPGDLLVNMKGCEDTKERDCEKEVRTYYTKWKAQQQEQRGGSGAGGNAVEADGS